MQWGGCGLILIASWVFQWALVKLSRRSNLGSDERAGVQKFHTHRVSRLGGVGIFMALTAGLLLTSELSHTQIVPSIYFIVSLFPAFGIGLLEDISAKVGVLTRLAFTMVAAAIGWWLFGVGLTRVSIPMVDTLLAASPVLAFGFTIIAAAGVAHAVNIIDGYNGLSGFFCAVVCLGLAYVAHAVGDIFVARTALAFTAAICGFMILNYPNGLIFLGDSGAYLLGFGIAELSILLVARHPQVSPWFPMLLVIYPVWETLFSIYRKKVLRGVSPGQPDGLHLHMLIYKRLIKTRFSLDPAQQNLMRNSATSPYLWILTCITVGPAVLMWRGEWLLIAATLLFILLYIWLYWSIVRFRTPPYMVLSSKAGELGLSAKPLDISVSQ